MLKRRPRPDQKLVEETLRDAYDFDPRDPLFGLSKEDLSGPQLSRRSVLRLMAAAGTLSVAHVLAACAPTAAPATTQSGESAAPATPSGGELTAGWAGTAEIRTLDPASINQVLQFQLASNILSGLTHINNELIAAGDLAENWEVSEDGLEWTFYLRQGVTFHNGDDLTADDVLFTYNRSKDPEQSIHYRVLDNVVDLEKVDDYTVKFTLGAPQASFLVKTLERASGRAMTIVSRRALEEMGGEQYSLTPVGTGPFRVTEHQLGQSVVLERFDDYFDPERPKLDKITVIPIPEPEPLAAAIEAGDIQFIGGNAPAPELVDRFLGNPDLVVSEITGVGFQSLYINPHRDPFPVPDFNKPLEELKQEPGFMVRLAIAKAIDRDDLIQRALFGRGAPAYGTINPAMRFYYDESIAETSEQRYDPEEARRLLAEAGYPDGEGFPTLPMIVTPSGRREGEILADILKQNLNITVELDIKDFPVLQDHRNRMDFHLLRIGSGGDYDPDDGLVDFMQTSSKFNGPDRPDDLPFGYFSETTVDELVEQQRVEADLEKRRELVQEANQITSDKVAQIFLFHPQDIIVYRKEVNYPDESRIPGLADLDRATIEQ